MLVGCVVEKQPPHPDYSIDPEIWTRNYRRRYIGDTKATRIDIPRNTMTKKEIDRCLDGY